MSFHPKNEEADFEIRTINARLITYHWRANAIRKRGSGPYDDRLGPTVLCGGKLSRFLVSSGKLLIITCHLARL
jgi:hypothetical protein